MCKHKIILESLLPHDQVEKFAKWAWGPDFKNYTVLEIFYSWNKRHKNILEIKINGKIEKDMIKMIEIWKGEKV